MKKSAKSAKKRQRSFSHAKSERNILQEQVAAFEKKFGRRPEPNDPLFFDPDADEPRALSAEKIDKDILAAMRVAGTPQHIVYAFKKTGLLLLDDVRSTYSAEEVGVWDAAIDEYWSMAAKAEHSDAQRGGGEGPLISQSKIPGLSEMPLSAEDQRFIFACLGAIDEHLETQPTSLRVKIELAAAILVMGASSAFAAASHVGHPQGAQDSYDMFVSLVELRTRELFEQKRRQ